MPYLDTSLFKNATKMQIFGKIVKGNNLFTKTVSKKERKKLNREDFSSLYSFNLTGFELILQFETYFLTKDAETKNSNINERYIFKIRIP